MCPVGHREEVAVDIHTTTAWGILFALCIAAALVLRMRQDVGALQALYHERSVWVGAAIALGLYLVMVAIVTI